MKLYFKKILLGAFTILLSALLLCGCNEEALKSAESVVHTYLTALSGFNVKAMESCLSEGTNKDFGIDTSIIGTDYVQTATYKKAVESMLKGLSGTIQFSINSSEVATDNTIVVNVTISAADVKQEDVDSYMVSRMDAYVQAHPELAGKSDLEQNDISIQVMSETYNEFVKLQPKVEQTFDITLIEKDDSWKIASSDANKPLVDWLSDLYGTF